MSEEPSKLANAFIGAAGVHFVAFRLTLRGLIVLPTIRNTAGIDLLVNDPRTGAHASIQVKTSLKWAKFWPTSRPETCLRGPHSFYVFLRYDPGTETFDAFLESGDRVARQIEANAEDYRQRGRRKFPYWMLPSPEEEERLRGVWRSWLPPL